jgi:putative tryptophan/tyrosine transport system substrate-binding protein
VIVFVGASDPVGAGYVESFARLGRNITGFILFEPSMVGKWLQALKELAPSVSQVAMMFNPETATRQGTFYSQEFGTAAAALSVESSIAAVRSANEIEAAISALGQKPNSALIVASDTFTSVHGELIVTLAARHRLPTVYPFPHFAKIGGLMSYGPDTAEPALGLLHRPHPQGREAGQPAGTGADQVSAGDQPKDRQGARPRRPHASSATRRRDDRMIGRMSAIGP